MEKKEDIKSVKKCHSFFNPNSTIYKVTDQDDNILQVPNDSSNRHYKIILEWVEDGNTIQEADPIPEDK